jgi:phosphatidylglycerol lysyltransferase
MSRRQASSASGTPGGDATAIEIPSLPPRGGAERREHWVRTVLALAVAAMGVIDLLSALLSRPSERLMAIRHLVPTDVLDTSRTFTLLAGTLLLVTAWGLRAGKRRAFVAALLLCAVSVPVNVLKSLDFEEATTAAVLMFALGVSADAFRVKSRALSLRWVSGGALIAAAALIVYAVLGCWLLERRYGLDASFARALVESAYRLVGFGNRALVFRSNLGHADLRVIRWFLDSVSLLGVIWIVSVALAALRPVAHRRRHPMEARRVAELLARYGESTVSAFALEPENDYFFSANGRAVIAYRFESDTLLAVGDPIGPPEELPALLASFADFCREHDWEFAFFQARPERLPSYKGMGWRAVHIGEDPILWTDRFTLEGSAMGDVRRSARRLEAAGIEARMFVPGENPFDPSRDPEGLYDQMRRISAEWTRAQHGVERGFCMGRFDSQNFRDTWLAVAWNPEARRVEAFVTWVPIPARRGWALDLMRRTSDAAPGVMEFLVARSVEVARARGDAMLSLSLSALASVEDDERRGRAVGEPQTVGEPRAAASAVHSRPDRARELLMQHLARFYDFKNLFQWKKKFGPAFEDRYLVYADPLALPRVVVALARAQSAGGLMGYLRGR